MKKRSKKAAAPRVTGPTLAPPVELSARRRAKLLLMQAASLLRASFVTTYDERDALASEVIGSVFLALEEKEDVRALRAMAKGAFVEFRDDAGRVRRGRALRLDSSLTTVDGRMLSSLPVTAAEFVSAWCEQGEEIGARNLAEWALRVFVSTPRRHSGDLLRRWSMKSERDPSTPAFLADRDALARAIPEVLVEHEGAVGRGVIRWIYQRFALGRPLQGLERKERRGRGRA